MKGLFKYLKVNGYDVYHKGNKPTPAEIGTYTKNEIDSKITSSNGTKITVSTEPPTTHVVGQVWLQI
ncbi:hypothetical protein NE683_12385 [Bariatricus massiliensis]|uniref:Uncharacterized protein n=1 Tax=Bariatricus massiliensis TaxID=1745713 RepID=A0ABS8DH46_9FIRM|nr:hypothetical protein [Bariatricus massiliensis]MCB7306194.1 hypothetical protein [Bariatricus massiliensis]MCB7375272.1 hypothetical protein [Bariatricus massiliensis]MCB7387732.1 hypothetical protein [Bariatricus massiliensis]MCB7411893.1 hypothetical protein [Bariatricus massiliensis]MCQ5254029.1 hypothetical protein [Bariatricus massiliensis]